MQIHVLDPDYASSERARANFRLALKIALRRLDVPPRKRFTWDALSGTLELCAAANGAAQPPRVC